MFHTFLDASERKIAFPEVVVIPWRGFRCFTRWERVCVFAIHSMVVIPWRGFRCFTRGITVHLRRVGPRTL